MLLARWHLHRRRVATAGAMGAQRFFSLVHGSGNAKGRDSVHRFRCLYEYEFAACDGVLRQRCCLNFQLLASYRRQLHTTKSMPYEVALGNAQYISQKLSLQAAQNSALSTARVLGARCFCANASPGDLPGTSPSKPSSEPPTTAASGAVVVYRFAYVRVLRATLRLKIAHMIGSGVVVMSCVSWAGGASAFESVILAAIGFGTVVVGSTLSWYCQRLIQELSWRPSEQVLRISTLSLWGHRLDRDYPLDAITPSWGADGPARSEVNRLLIPFEVNGVQFIIVNSKTNMRRPNDLVRLMAALPPLDEAEAKGDGKA